MPDINPQFPQTDVALVIGANDVTNPAARDVPDSPIYGMPILDVDKSVRVIVLMRGMATGFAAIDTPLFYKDNTSMLFGDAKESIQEITQQVKQLGPPVGIGHSPRPPAAVGWGEAASTCAARLGIVRNPLGHVLKYRH